MLAAAVRDYVVNYAVSPGDRTVVVTNNDSAYQTALALKAAGLDVPPSSTPAKPLTEPCRKPPAPPASAS